MRLRGPRHSTLRQGPGGPLALTEGGRERSIAAVLCRPEPAHRGAASSFQRGSLVGTGLTLIEGEPP